MSFTPTLKRGDPRWVILWRDHPDQIWSVHRHHSSDTPFRYKDLSNCSSVVRGRRKKGQEAMAVREDRAFAAYGVTV
jgi:hypothetical protein